MRILGKVIIAFTIPCNNKDVRVTHYGLFWTKKSAKIIGHIKLWRSDFRVHGISRNIFTVPFWVPGISRKMGKSSWIRFLFIIFSSIIWHIWRFAKFHITFGAPQFEKSSYMYCICQKNLAKNSEKPCPTCLKLISPWHFQNPKPCLKYGRQYGFAFFCQNGPFYRKDSIRSDVYL